MNKEDNLKHLEYYVVFYKGDKRCSSRNFLIEKDAKEYAESMKKTGHTRIEICTYRY